MASPQVATIAVTQADSSNTDFSPVVNRVIVRNIGTNLCYFTLNETATTSMFELEPDDEISIGLATITDVHAICDTGLTTTLRVVGIVQW